jgi:putative glutamate/gamma-aminobutyrate antiporter
MTEKKRVLNTFMLAMINVAAVCSIKNWPINAEYGVASLFFLGIAALCFFIPIALVSAELATGWPESGGVFVWVKEAFGHRLGFLAMWYLWMTNIPWYPTILAFIAGAISFIIDPELANNKLYMVIMVLVLFWTATFLNLRGMKTSGWISTIGVILGTILPGCVIIMLGCIWAANGRPMQIEFTWKEFLPDLTHLDQLVLLTGMILSLAGIEMSAVHAQEVKHPQKDYPKAILLSAILIIILSSLGTLAIASVIPQKTMSLVSGGLDAFAYFFKAYHLGVFMPAIALCIAVGAYSQMSTWLVGPAKGLLAVAKIGDLPAVCHQLNKHGMPISLLIFQAIVVSLMALVFLIMPSVSSSFWILIALTAQFYVLLYILMFAAAIRLRYTRPHVKRAYKVPGGFFGIWIIGGVGIIVSMFTLFMGFIPPSQLSTGSLIFYESFLFLGIILSTLVPFIILLFKKRGWKTL